MSETIDRPLTGRASERYVGDLVENASLDIEGAFVFGNPCRKDVIRILKPIAARLIAALDQNHELASAMILSREIAAENAELKLICQERGIIINEMKAKLKEGK